MKKGEYGKAYLVFKGLRETPLQAASKKLDPGSRISNRLTKSSIGDLYLIYAQLKVETLLFSGEEVTPEKLAQLFRVPQTAQPGEPVEPASTKHSSIGKFFQRLPELFKIRRNLRAVVGSSVVMIAQYVRLHFDACSHKIMLSLLF
jgi:hypothetical protein